MKLGLAALLHPKFRWFLLGSFFSATGLWMVRLAQSLLAVSSGGGTSLGLTMAAQFIPVLLLSAPIGLLADRFGPPRVLIVGELVMAVTVATQAVILMTHAFQPWQGYVFAVCLGIGSAMDNPTRLSSIPAMVPSSAVVSAVSLNMVALQIGRLVGPTAAGYFSDGLGLGAAFASAAITFGLFAIVLGILIRLADDIPARSAREPRALRAGFVYVRSRPDLGLMFLVVGVGGLVGPNLPNLATLMVLEVFEGDAGDVGMVSAVLAVGALLGVAWTTRRGRTGVRSVAIASVLTGITSAVTAIAPNLLVYSLLMLPAGFAALFMVSQASALLQLNVAEVVRGRVTALYSVVLVAGVPVVSPVIGVLSDLVGTRWAVLGAGTTVAVINLSAYLIWRAHLPIASESCELLP